MYSLTILRWF